MGLFFRLQICVEFVDKRTSNAANKGTSLHLCFYVGIHILSDYFLIFRIFIDDYSLLELLIIVTK